MSPVSAKSKRMSGKPNTTSGDPACMAANTPALTMPLIRPYPMMHLFAAYDENVF